MYLLRLKSLLQYNYIYAVLIFVALLTAYVRINLPIRSQYSLDTKEFTGVLIDKKIDGDKFTFTINGKEKIRCTYYIQDEQEKHYLENLDLGITIKLLGQLSKPPNNTIPNAFNYKKYLHSKKINYTLAVEKYQVINNKTSTLYTLKNFLISHINKYKSSNYLLTFIIGNKDQISDEVMGHYQSLGVSHIFAISGMHVSMLSGIILFILKKIKLKDTLCYIIVIVIMLFYLFITNYQASILRTVGLFILSCFNREFDLNISIKNILILDIAILLFLNPSFLIDIGFLYSCIVSYSLITYSRLIKGNYIAKTLKVSLIAFLFSLPITIVTNYEFNVLSVIDNLFVVPIVSALLYPLSLLTIIFPFLDEVLFVLINLFENISKYLPMLNIIIPKFHPVFIILYYILLLLFFNTYQKKFIIMIILMFFCIKYVNYSDPSMTVYYLDVGQGDSVIIKYKNKCVMIDTGGTLSYKKENWQKKKAYNLTDNTLKFLKSIGIYDIDYLILTHGDFDHLGESSNIVNNYKVRNVLFNKGEYNSLENKLIYTLNNKNIKYYNDVANINIDAYSLQLLDTQLYDNENDNSIVLYLKYYNWQFLFMGDAGKEREEAIIAKYNINNIDFLKVGHHGSNTSSSKTFISKINPRYSIISVGKNNRYKHPNDQVIKTLSNSQIYRTDEAGSIKIKLYKNKFSIKNFSP